MRDQALVIFLLLVTVMGGGPYVTGCSSPADDDFVQTTEDGRITITDRTDKVWDVTHAVANYGFQAAQFQFGLGPNAILPVNDPQFAEPGHEDYPADDSFASVIGVVIDGDARAYSVPKLSRHEVVNDRWGDAHVAVAY